MTQEEWKIKNMLHRVSLQLDNEEMLDEFTTAFNDKFIVQLDELEPSQFAAEVERMRGTR